MRESFRKDYMKAANLWLRLFDFTGHCLGAYLMVLLFGLPWHYSIVQWLPDLMLPIIWPWSIITGKYLGEKNVFLLIHKWLHNPKDLLLWLACYYTVLAYNARQAGRFVELELAFLTIFVISNILAHFVIDSLTHEEPR